MAALWSSVAYVAQIQMLIYTFYSLEIVIACFHLRAPCSKQSIITARKNLNISQGGEGLRTLTSYVGSDFFSLLDIVIVAVLKVDPWKHHRMAHLWDCCFPLL